MVYIALLMALIFIGADQWIKVWAAENLAGKVPVQFIKFGDTEVINLSYCENTGAAFSILSGQTTLLSIITAVVIIIAIYLLLSKKIKQPFLIFSVALIIAGGLGNLIDRIFRGYVIDYIEVKLFRFAVFNFADCCVVIGAIMMMVFALFLDKESEPKKEIISEENTQDETERSENE